MAGAAATLDKPAVQNGPKMKAAVTSAKAPDYVEGRRNFFSNQVTLRDRRQRGMDAGASHVGGDRHDAADRLALPCLRGPVCVCAEGLCRARVRGRDPVPARGRRLVLYPGRHEAQRDPHVGRCRDHRGRIRRRWAPGQATRRARAPSSRKALEGGRRSPKDGGAAACSSMAEQKPPRFLPTGPTFPPAPSYSTACLVVNDGLSKDGRGATAVAAPARRS